MRTYAQIIVDELAPGRTTLSRYRLAEAIKDIRKRRPLQPHHLTRVLAKMEEDGTIVRHKNSYRLSAGARRARSRPRSGSRSRARSGSRSRARSGSRSRARSAKCREDECMDCSGWAKYSNENRRAPPYPSKACRAKGQRIKPGWGDHSRTLFEVKDYYDAGGQYTSSRWVVHKDRAPEVEEDSSSSESESTSSEESDSSGVAENPPTDADVFASQAQLAAAYAKGAAFEAGNASDAAAAAVADVEEAFALQAQLAEIEAMKAEIEAEEAADEAALQAELAAAEADAEEPLALQAQLAEMEAIEAEEAADEARAHVEESEAAAAFEAATEDARQEESLKASAAAEAAAHDAQQQDLLSTLRSIYHRGYAPPAVSDTFFLKDARAETLRQSVRVYHDPWDNDGAGLMIHDLMKYREPVNMSMHRHYFAGKLATKHDYSESKYQMYFAANQKLAPNVALYVQTPVWADSDRAAPRAITHVLNVIGPTLDSSQQPDSQVLTSVAMVRRFLRSVCAKIERCILDLGESVTDIYLCAFGSVSSSASSFYPKGIVDYRKMLKSALQSVVDQPSLQQKRFYFMGGPKDEDLATQLEEVKFAGDFNKILEKKKPAALERSLFLNAWDPHSVPGSGNARDDSLDGQIGRRSAIGWLGWGVSNPHLLESSRYVPVQSWLPREKNLNKGKPLQVQEIHRERAAREELLSSLRSIYYATYAPPEESDAFYLQHGKLPDVLRKAVRVYHDPHEVDAAWTDAELTEAKLIYAELINDLLSQREPVNIKMETYFHTDVLMKQHQYALSKYRMHFEESGVLAPNIAVYVRTPVWADSDKDQGSTVPRAITHVLNVIGLAMDSEEQPDYEVVTTANTDAVERLVRDFVRNVCAKIKRCVQDLDDRVEDIYLCAFGAGAFASKYPQSISYRGLLTKALQEIVYSPDLSNKQWYLMGLPGDKALVKKLNQLGAEEFEPVKFAGEFQEILEKKKPAALARSLFINAWDPHSVPGNGNAMDNSLDGEIGRRSAIGWLGWGISNPCLLERSRHIAVKRKKRTKITERRKNRSTNR